MRSRGVNEDAVLLEGGGHFASRRKGRVYLKPNEVGFHLRRIEPQARSVRNRLRDHLRVTMVVRQALDVVTQGVKRGGGETAGLAHSAAEEFADAPRFAMKSRDPANADPTGAPSPLLKHTDTLSNGSAQTRGSIPLATTAFQRRAPSR